jgi:hypothetical protein
MPGARRTRSLVCAWGSEYAHEYSQRVRRDHPASPRNGLRLMPCSPRRSGCLASVACETNSANLTPASRRQDHTSSPSASVPFVIGTSSVHRIPPRVRDDREPPLRWDETARISEVIWVGQEAKIFFAMGIDSPNHTKSGPSGNRSGVLARGPACLTAPSPAAGMCGKRRSVVGFTDFSIPQIKRASL